MGDFMEWTRWAEIFKASTPPELSHEELMLFMETTKALKNFLTKSNAARAVHKNKIEERMGKLDLDDAIIYRALWAACRRYHLAKEFGESTTNMKFAFKISDLIDMTGLGYNKLEKAMARLKPLGVEKVVNIMFEVKGKSKGKMYTIRDTTATMKYATEAKEVIMEATGRVPE